MNTKLALSAVVGAVLGSAVHAADWPMWGGSVERNLFSSETGLPNSFEPGDYLSGSEDIDLETTKNVKWVTKLGSQAYGNTTVADGRLFIGTNNESPRDEKHIGDRGVVYCLDEETGALNWQLVAPKLGAGKVSDWEFLGICSSPAVDGDRVYVVSNRCEILCLDVHGMANGNQGYADEGLYMAGAGNAPVEPGATDADILWIFDMRDELGVFPHNIASSSVLVVGDRLYCTTSNGQDWSHLNIPSPLAPTLICLNKETGELLGEELSGISEGILHCNWSSPSAGTFGGKQLVVFGAGDGKCYAYDPVPVYNEDEGLDELPEIWRFDCIPDDYKVDADGEELIYPDPEGPSEIIATPVVYKERVYISLGQDPEHGEGVGRLVCIDGTKSGDITESGLIWEYRKINRTISTVGIDPSTGLLFAADYSGFVYCLDAETGEEHWVYDMKAHMWSSPLVADGKVYVADEDGDLVILPAKADFDPKNDDPIFETYFAAPVYSSPVATNGVLYVASQTHLYAIEAAE